MSDEATWHSIPQLAALLKAQFGRAPHRVNLSRLAREGRIPAQKVGRNYAVRGEDLPAIAAALGLSPARSGG